MQNTRRIIGFINAAHALDHMFMLIFPAAVLGMSSSFHQSYGQLLTLSLGGFIAFGAGSIPAGWLGDVWSRRNMLGIFFIGIGLSAIATSFAPSAFWISVGLTFIGLFASIYHPVGTAMLTACADRLGREIGINGVWGNTGVAFAALVTGGLTQFFGWQYAFLVPGVIAVAIGIAYMLTVPDVPIVKKLASQNNVAFPRNVVIRAFSVLVGVSIFGSIVFNAVTVSMPKVFDERLNLLVSTPLGIGGMVFVVYMIGAMSQIIIGRLVDKRSLRSVFLPLSALQAPCLLLAAYASNWWLLLLAVGMMFAIFGQVTINDTMVAKYTADAWRSRAYAVRYLMSFGASACSVPFIAYVHDHAGGFQAVYQILAVFGLMVFVGAIFFPDRPDEVAPPNRAVPAT
jgi:MFS family permease